MVYIDQKNCISCGACVVLCPVHAITLQNGRAWVDSTLCVECARCVPKCYMRAITLDVSPVNHT